MITSRLPPLWFAAFFILLLGGVTACGAPSAVPHPLPPLTPRPTAATAPGSTAPVQAVPTVPATECPNADCADACLSELRTIPFSSGSSSTRPKGAGHGAMGPPAILLATYPVDGDQLGAPRFPRRVPPGLSPLQHDGTAQVKIWAYFTAIIPANWRTELASYIVSTDGKGGMLASVEQFSGQSDTWALVVDPADAGRPRDLTFTLLHEFGHLLTLNDSQVRPDQAVLERPDSLRIFEQEATSCPQFFAAGGCSLPDSYINQFFQQFWTKLYGEWSVVNAARQDSNYTSLLAHFYNRHPSQFITPYASTSPEEDMAETWAYFVLNPKPAPDSIAHRKVLFFYKHPELVDLRNGIIASICKYAAGH